MISTTTDMSFLLYIYNENIYQQGSELTQIQSNELTR